MATNHHFVQNPKYVINCPYPPNSKSPSDKMKGIERGASQVFAFGAESPSHK